jgi:hypothetical protein
MSRWPSPLGPGDLLGTVRWLVGAEAKAPTGGATGFGMEALAPSRNRGPSERGIALLTAVAATLNPWFVLSHVAGDGWAAAGWSAAWLLAAPGLLWCARMLLPPRLPMDRAALALGGYTFAPWGMAMLARPRRADMGDILGDLTPLVWHAAAFALVAVIGLAMDIRGEMRRSGQPRDSGPQ